VLEQYQVQGRSATEIAASVERGIREGRLRTEERLPPIRRLASALQVSPATVAAAYRSLRERGLVIADGRHGTVVSRQPPLSTPAPVALPPGVRDLRTGLPDRRLLPDLRRVVAQLDEPAAELWRDAGRNDGRLLDLARARFAADGVDATHVAVVGGALDGVERALATHVRRGDLVAVEDPSYPPILDLLGAIGATPVAVSVDDQGLQPASLERALRRGPAALLLVPRAQNPTGAALSTGRAGELRASIAGHDQLLVIEDDHAHEIAGTEFVGLTQRWGGRWSLIRSASKGLNPDLRLAVMAGDAVTVSRIEGRQALGTGWVSTILQRTVAALWSDPEVDEVVAAARTTYAQRRTALITALAQRGLVATARSGFNIWIPVRDEAAAVEGLLSSGWAVRPGEAFRLRSAPSIRISAATLEVDEAPALADAVVATQRGAGFRAGQY
jgi:DNA-binding transcriptional MocR family regulator